MSDFVEELKREETEQEKKHAEEMAIIMEMEIDQSMLTDLSPEDWLNYDVPHYKLERLEGDWIAKFDRKVREGGITVVEKFRNFIEEHGVPMRGMDPRTGIYGIKAAAGGFYSAGIRYREKDKFDEAIANFAKAIELNPRHAVARSKKAECHYMKGDYIRAECEIFNAIRLNPVRIMEITGTTLDMLKEFMEPGTELNPGVIEWYESRLVEDLVLRGTIFLNDEDWDDALLDFEEVIRRNPNVLNGYHARLTVNMKFKEWEKVIPDADKCIKEDYKKLYAQECRGIAYEHLDRIDEAIADFDAVLAVMPNQSTAYLHRSYCHSEKKNYRQAVDDAAEAIRCGSEEAYYHRGIAYSELGEYDKAVDDFDKALDLFDFEDEWYDPGDEDHITYAREKAIKLRAGVSDTSKPEEQNKEPL